jgi:hypothetical protein
MIYHRGADKLDRGYRLLAMQDYLRAVNSCEIVKFSHSTSSMIDGLIIKIDNGDKIDELEWLADQIFTLTEIDDRKTARLQLNRSPAEWANIKLTVPEPSVRLNGECEVDDFIQAQMYRTVATIVASLCPMKSRLNRDDIPQATVDKEIDVLTLLLQKQAHLTPENLVTVAKAVIFHREFTDAMVPKIVLATDPICTHQMTLDTITSAIEVAASRYKPLCPE